MQVPLMSWSSMEKMVLFASLMRIRGPIVRFDYYKTTEGAKPLDGIRSYSSNLMILMRLHSVLSMRLYMLAAIVEMIKPR
jgi:hypothetical protein